MKKKMLQFEKDFWSGAPLEQMFLKKKGEKIIHWQ